MQGKGYLIIDSIHGNMHLKSIITYILFAGLALSGFSQNGIVRGRVVNTINNEPLEFATLVLEGTAKGAYTDTSGAFEITGIPPGLYNLQVSYTGFKRKFLPEIEVTNAAGCVKVIQDSVLVQVDDKRYEVHRDQLEPLKELRNLEKKAKAGCSKHENGGCDCGAKK